MIFFKQSLQQQQCVISVEVLQDAAVINASYELCYILGKHMKPFTDAEIVKECFISASSLLNLSKFSDKNKIKKIQLSDSTCIRRTENITKLINIIEYLKKF